MRCVNLQGTASIFIKTINIANIAFLKNIMPIKLFLIKKL